MAYYVQSLSLFILVIKEGEFLAKQNQLWLLRERKLSLIVDLDQTLLHTTSNLDIKKGKILVRNFPQIIVLFLTGIGYTWLHTT